MGLTLQQAAWFRAYTEPHPTDCTCSGLFGDIDPCPWHDRPVEADGREGPEGETPGES